MRRRNVFLPSRSQSAGFSLLEMMVAMVVMSIALGVLYQALSGATRNASVAAQYVEANMLAESLLNDYSRAAESEWADAGLIGEFSWVVETLAAPLPDNGGVAAQADDPSQNSLRTLRVSVSWGEQGRERVLQLMTVIPFVGVTP